MRNYRLHFIRHGITEGNLKGQYVGRTDQEVCLEGIRQLIDLKETCLYPEVERVYSSPLTRCVQTAGILYPQHPLQIVHSLAELHFGEYEGKTMEQLKDRPDFQRWLASSLTVSPPGGENSKDFTARILSGVEDIFRQMMDQGLHDAAVITHGGVIMTLLYTLGLPKAEFRDWYTGNGRGYTVAMSAQMWMRDGAFEVQGQIPVGADTLAPRMMEEFFDTLEEEAGG